MTTPRPIPSSLALIALLILACCPLGAQEFIVAPTGSDPAGDGSLAHPWQTLAKAIAAVNARAGGDTISLRAGTYTQTSANLVNKPDLTIRGYPGEAAHITAAVDSTGHILLLWIASTAKRIEIEDLDFSGGYYAIKFEAGTSRADVGGGVGTWIKRCRIHGTFADGIKVAGGASTPWNEMLPAATDILIEDCEIFATRQGTSTNGQGIDNVLGHRMVVRGCFIHDIPNDNGIAIKGGAEDCIVEGNTISGMGSGIAVGQDTGEDFFDHVANPHSFEAIRHIVRNNLITGMVNAGIQTWASKDCKIYNNTLIDVARATQGGLFVTSHDHYDWSAGDGTFTIATVACEGLRLENNIVVLPDSSTRFGVYMQIGAYRLGDRPVLLGNRYQHIGRTARFVDVSQYPLGPYYNGGLSGWAAFIGSETGSTEGDPGLTADGHLAAGSPCIDAGADTLADVPTDKDGNARSLPIDVGAYEQVADGGTGGTATATATGTGAGSAAGSGTGAASGSGAGNAGSQGRCGFGGIGAILMAVALVGAARSRSRRRRPA